MPASSDPLCSPCNIGPLSVRSPFVFLPFATRYCDADGLVTKTMRNHYRRYAESGVGLVVVEAASIRQAAAPYSFSAYDDAHVPGLKRLADAIHEAGAKASLQIVHPGRFSFAPGSVAPSAVAPFGNPELLPRALTEEEMHAIADGFAEAAEIAWKAGFDAAELHGATGYLLSSFTSPLSNRRKDAYGGSRENRFRFPLEICRAVRERVGAFPVGYRLMAKEYRPGGLSLEEGVALAACIAEELDPAYLSVTAGTYECWAMQAESKQKDVPGYMLEEAEAVAKRLPNVAVIAAGMLCTREACLQAREQAGAAGIGLGRPLFSDSNLVRKLCGEDDAPIRTCKQCGFCQNCLGKGKPVACANWTKEERQLAGQ